MKTDSYTWKEKCSKTTRNKKSMLQQVSKLEKKAMMKTLFYMMTWKSANEKKKDFFALFHFIMQVYQLNQLSILLHYSKQSLHYTERTIMVTEYDKGDLRRNMCNAFQNAFMRHPLQVEHLVDWQMVIIRMLL